MDVSLTKLLLLLFSFVRYSLPDGWDVAYSVGVSIVYPGPNVVLEARIDPVAIYYRPLPDNLCGYARGAYVVVDPQHREKGCLDTLQHELGHISQGRTWGLAQPLTYPLNPSWWEPPVPWRGTEGMYIPSGLNWPLIRLWVPLY